MIDPGSYTSSSHLGESLTPLMSMRARNHHADNAADNLLHRLEETVVDYALLSMRRKGAVPETHGNANGKNRLKSVQSNLFGDTTGEHVENHDSERRVPRKT